MKMKLGAPHMYWSIQNLKRNGFNPRVDIHRGVPLFRYVVEFMYDSGFVAYDICSVSARRPIDLALWQTDLIFVRENSVFRADKRYHA